MKTFTEPKTYDNYFEKSIGQWKACKKPKRKSDYISYKRNYLYSRTDDIEQEFINANIDIKHYKHHFEYCSGYRLYYEDKRLGVSSQYWYGTDSKGDYIIRESSHWGKVASCIWHRTNNSEYGRVCAKIYLNKTLTN